MAAAGRVAATFPHKGEEGQPHDSAAKLCYAPRFLSGRC